MLPPRVVTESDDSFHPPDRDEIWWSETNWYTATDAQRALTLWIYPLFRPVMGICSLHVVAWDTRTLVPWEQPYWSFEWHLPMPAGNLTDFELNGLHHRCIEPLSSYHLEYTDGDRMRADLRFDGLREPWLLKREGGTGHFSQACRVTGSVLFEGKSVAIDAVGLRDRSWGPRHGNRTIGPAAMIWGVSSAAEHFLVNTGTPTVTARGTLPGQPLRPWGYLVRDGLRAEISRADSKIVSWSGDGYPARTELTLVDEADRQVELIGEVLNACPMNWNPNAFAWINQFQWTGADGASYVGQHQGAMRTLSAALR